MTIIRTHTDRILNSETVYKTAKLMGGTFSIDDIQWQINSQLDEGDQLTRKQVQSALNYISGCGNNLQKKSTNWYTWK